MSLSTKMSSEVVIAKAVEMVKANGWDSINARSLAKELEISTKPLYRLFNGMEEIKAGVYKEIYHEYDEFITHRVDNKNALITLCVAYVEFAKENKNLFNSLFLSHNLKWQCIENVLDEKWNQSTIINLVNKHGYSFEAAKELFMHMWLYANGLATLIATNDILMEDKEIIKRLVKIYKELVG